MVSTHLKNISQIGWFPQIGVKIKNHWNHQPDLFIKNPHNILWEYLLNFHIKHWYHKMISTNQHPRSFPLYFLSPGELSIPRSFQTLTQLPAGLSRVFCSGEPKKTLEISFSSRVICATSFSSASAVFRSSSWARSVDASCAAWSDR